MKKLVTVGIAAALVAGSFSAVAEPLRYQLQLSGVDFYYDPFQVYSEIGTESENPLSDFDNGGLGDGFDDDTGQSMTFGTLRDFGPDEDKIDPSLGMNDGDSDGRADATFGDLTYADPLTGIELFQETSPGSNSFNSVTLYEAEPIAIDFRIVLEQDEKITGPGTYDIIEEYSFFDILTQDGDNDNGEFDWGLALDASGGTGELVISGNDQAQVLITALAGEIFSDSDSNNLPFGYVDPNELISFGFVFNLTTPAWVDQNNESIPVQGTGNGNVTLAIPEPGMLGILGISLAGLGFLHRRRKQN